MSSQYVQLRPDVKIHAVVSNPRGQQQQQQNPTKKQPPTIVFLHFWGGSHRTWAKVISSLPAEYPYMAMDFRGWGDSTGPADAGGYSITHLATDVESTIASVLPPSSSSTEDIILVGLSMGGKVAQMVAGRGKCSRRILGTVLVSPAPPSPLVLPPEMGKQQLHAYDSVESARFVAGNVLTASGLPASDIERLAEDMVRGNEWATAAWPSYAMGEDITSEARKITSPVLVVAGDRDIEAPPDKLRREVCDVIKGSEMVVLEGSGHLSPADRPAELAAAIVSFVEKVAN